MNQVVFHLGSNIGEREVYLQKAVITLEYMLGNYIIKSSIFETEPWCFAANQNFLNQVVIINTNSSAIETLDIIQKIENDLCRIRNKKNSYESRTIDIDILFFNAEIIDTKSLKIPHPLITKRRFVLAPLCEILPEFYHPTENKKIKNLLEKCSDEARVCLWKKKL